MIGVPDLFSLFSKIYWPNNLIIVFGQSCLNNEYFNVFYILTFWIEDFWIEDSNGVCWWYRYFSKISEYVLHHCEHIDDGRVETLEGSNTPPLRVSQPQEEEYGSGRYKQKTVQCFCSLGKINLWKLGAAMKVESMESQQEMWKSCLKKAASYYR